jgi:hypothetical protein
MSALNAFVDATIKWFLIVAGAVTGVAVLFAISADAVTPMLGGFVDYTPSSVPLIRHWGIMVFGIGLLMVVAAFRPWLRFETMMFSTVEKSFMVYLFLSNLGQPWISGYLVLFVTDGAIVACSILYFISDRGRPGRWSESS